MKTKMISMGPSQRIDAVARDHAMGTRHGMPRPFFPRSAGLTAGYWRKAIACGTTMASKCLAAIFACALALPAVAQDSYPSRPIRIMVGFAPGGVTDILARQLGMEIQKLWGQPVVIENKPGAAGMIADEKVAHAAPDGYTLLMAANSLTINAAIHADSRIDPTRDFTPISVLADAPIALIVSAQSPYKTIEDYLAAAKKKPDSITYASSGVGTAPHFAGERFANATGTMLVHVPYKGANESLMAVMSGQVDSSWSGLNAALLQIESGKVRSLGVASDARSVLAPTIPTLKEQGVEGVRSDVWIGLLGPAGLPRDIAAKWYGQLQKILARPDIQEAIKTQGAEPVFNVGLTQFQAKLEMEVGEYTKLAKAAHIRGN